MTKKFNIIVCILLFTATVIASSWTKDSSVKLVECVKNNYYVSPNGCNLNDGSKLYPWKSLSFACKKAEEGCIIRLLEGTFYEDSICKIPKNVSIIGAGRDKTFIVSRFFYHDVVGAWDLAKDKYLIQYPKGCDGVEISHFSIDGNNHQSHGGIIIDDVKNIKIKNLHVKDFTFNGIWVSNSFNLVIENVTMHETSLPASNSCSGMLMLGNTENAEIFNCEFTNYTKDSGGYGIKTWDIDWDSYMNPAGETIKLTNLNIHHCKFELYPFGGWNNGNSVNICLELYCTSPDRCLITDNIFIGNLSMVGTNKEGVEYAVKVLNNQFLMPTTNESVQFAIENDFSNVEIAYNFIKNGMYPIASFNNVEVANLNVHHNVFDKIKLPEGILLFIGWPANLKFEHNTVLYDQSIFDWRGAPTEGNSVVFIKNPVKAYLISIKKNIFYCYDGVKKNNLKLIQSPLGEVNMVPRLTIDSNAFYNWMSDGSNSIEIPYKSSVFVFDGSDYKQFYGLVNKNIFSEKTFGAIY